MKAVERLARAIVARVDQPFDYLTPKRQGIYLKRAEDGLDALRLTEMRSRIDGLRKNSILAAGAEFALTIVDEYLA